MTLLSRALTTLGALLLAHACYSAQEHTSLSKGSAIDIASSSSSSAPSSTPQTSLPTPSTAAASLPADIILETLVSVLIVCIGLVLGSPALRPISWRVWAGSLERKGGAAGLSDGDAGAKAAARVNPFAALENRVGFWDIRAKRKEFDDWVQEESKSSRT